MTDPTDLSQDVTGNIYCDSFTDQGQRFHNYTIDCAACGQQAGLEPGVGRHRKARTVAIQMGWKPDAVSGKWVCPYCQLYLESLRELKDKILETAREWRQTELSGAVALVTRGDATDNKLAQLEADHLLHHLRILLKAEHDLIKEHHAQPPTRCPRCKKDIMRRGWCSKL